MTYPGINILQPSLFMLFISTVHAFVEDEFLLFTDPKEHAIYKFNLSTYEYEALHCGHLSPIAITFDESRKQIYWSDNGLRQIKRGDLDGEHSEVVRYLGNEGKVDGLGLDFVSGLLFYTDTGHKTISVVNLHGNNYQRTIIEDDLEEPRAIVPIPKTGIIYLTDWGMSPRIEKANYDGTERQAIITTGLLWPNGLAIDIREGIMYWSDAKFGRIQKSNLDGTDRSIISDQYNKAHFFGLTLAGTKLYYTDWSRRHVMELSLKSGMHYPVGKAKFSQLNGIHFSSGRYVLGYNGCTYKRGGCSHICIPSSDNTAKCLCPDGMFLQNDQKSCSVDSLDNSEPLRVMITGRTGVGKSTLGNVLIGKKVFAVPLVFSEQPGTLISSAAQIINHLGQYLRVVDTPGVKTSDKLMKDKIMKGLLLAKPGPHVILFVTKIGQFAESDEKAIEFYEKNLRSHFYEYLIVVFTGKEKLAAEGINIHDYVQSLSSTSKLKTLIEKTKNRYIAFSDTGFILDQKKNVDRLLDIIGRMMLKNIASPYYKDVESTTEENCKSTEHEKEKYKP